MKHNISITTAEALLINKALRMDMQNEIDNDMALKLIYDINGIVTYDLRDYRCRDCKYYEARQGVHKQRGKCTKKSNYAWEDVRYGRTKACKKYFEKGDQK